MKGGLNVGRKRKEKVTSENTVYFIDDRRLRTSVTFRLPVDVKEGLLLKIHSLYDENVIPRRVMAPAFFRAFALAFLDHPAYFLKLMKKYL